MEGVRAYANPPWNLLGRVLARAEKQTADLILVAPVWPSQPWYPRLLNLLIAVPLRIRQRGAKQVMLQVGEGHLQR